MPDEKKTYLINIESNLQKYADEAVEAKKKVDELAEANFRLKNNTKASASEIEANNAALRNAQKEYNQAKKMVDLQTAANKSEVGSRKQLGEILTLQMQALGKLGNAYTKDAQGIMRLNPLYVEQRKRIAETKQAILDYDKALNDGRSNVGRYGEAIGGAFEGAGKSVLGFASIASLAVAGVTLLFNGLKEAIMSTTTAINFFNNVSQGFKQGFYDLVTGGGLNIGKIKFAIEAQRELNAVRIRNYAEDVKEEEMQKELSELRLKAADQTRDMTDKLNILNQIETKSNELKDFRIQNLKEEQDATLKLLAMRPDDESLLANYMRLSAEVQRAQNQSATELRRNETMKTGMLETEEKKRADAAKARLDAELAAYEWFLKTEKKLDDEAKKEKEVENKRLQKEWEDGAKAYLDKRKEFLKREAEIELENQKLKLQISELSITNEFELKRKQLENDRIMEEKSGADINLINEKYALLRINLSKIEADAKLSVYAQFAGAIGSLFQEHTIMAKVAAIAEATINTYLGATQALKTYPPPLSFIAAAAQVAAGLAAVAKIVSVDTNVKGGGSMPTSITSSAPARNISVNQVQSSILTNPQLSQMQLNALPQNMLSAADIANAMSKLPPQKVSVVDINEGIERVNKIQVRANI